MRSPACIIRTAFAVLCLYGAALHAASFPDPPVDNKNLVGDLLKGDQTAVLAGGCFWCVEAVFRQIAGVDRVVSGYTGGDAATAHYDMVSTGKTGHVESVKITYNPRKVSYGQLLKVFFEVAHDPTQLNRQGADVGPQYRSMIFYRDAEQKRIAEAYIKQLNEANVLHAPIVTEVVPLASFYPAEEHHQNYCNRHPTDQYVQEVAMPKVEKAKKQFPELLKSSAAGHAGGRHAIRLAKAVTRGPAVRNAPYERPGEKRNPGLSAQR